MATTFKGLDKYQKQEDAATFRVGSDDPEVGWYGNQPVRGKNAIPATGWHIAGEGVYADLEKAIIAYNVDHASDPFRLATIMHEMSKKDSVDWTFPENLNFFVLCRGIGTPFAEKGIVSCYGPKWNSNDETESKFYVRAYISELLEYGYDHPIQFRMASKGRTQSFQSVLIDQQRVLQEFKKLQGVAMPYWGFSLPIGADMVEVKSSKKADSKSMYLPVSLIPKQITEEYLASHYIGNHMLGEDLSEMCSTAFKESVEWAQEATKALLRGKVETPAKNEAPTDDASPVFDENGEVIETAPVQPKSKPARKQLPDDGELATDQLRRGLEIMAVRKGQAKPEGIMKNVKVTKGEIRQIIWEYNDLPDVRQN